MLTAKAFLLCTGAQPAIPPIPGLTEVPFVTYLQLFENDRLPQRLLILGTGPLGLEMGQAYQRLGAQVVLVGERLLPKDEPEAGAALGQVLAREGLEFARGRATQVARDGATILVTVGDQLLRGDLLLLALGRVPVVGGLDLERAGVVHSPQGIAVDTHLRTNVKHIFAAGDCTGGYQFTHFAGWQAFQAVRNALLPGSSPGFSAIMPWVTFTDPEVAHVGCSEAAARRQFGDAVVATYWSMERTDRAICENDLDGFIKVVHKPDGTLLGATIVAGRAGEAITEFVLALHRGLKLSDLARPIHAYPTYSTPVQQLAAQVAVEHLRTSLPGQVIRRLSGLSGSRRRA
ncbi:MAG: FAD-dependent oxidoreductase [Actinomycetota bacterium]|nr:FAD-dependent oxidoreductase [Actinomycetota bacterium]